jgi:hypothetical protein
MIAINIPLGFWLNRRVSDMSPLAFEEQCRRETAVLIRQAFVRYRPSGDRGLKNSAPWLRSPAAQRARA